LPRLPDAYYEQMSHPHGRLAWVAAWWMNVGNQVINRQALDALEPTPSDRALEVGFGGGFALRKLLRQCRRVSGADPSAAMVAYTTDRYAAHVEAGRLDLRKGSVEALPWDDATFDKVLAVNTIYFWDDIEQGCRELRRVVTEDGRVVIAAAAAATCRWFRWGEVGYFVPEEPVVTGFLRSAGFGTVRVIRRRNLGGTQIFVAEP
jgi:arsenite methyltransferase